MAKLKKFVVKEVIPPSKAAEKPLDPSKSLGKKYVPGIGMVQDAPEEFQKNPYQSGKILGKGQPLDPSVYESPAQQDLNRRIAQAKAFNTSLKKNNKEKK